MKKLFKRFIRCSLRISLFSIIVSSMIIFSAIPGMCVKKIVPEESDRKITLSLGDNTYATSENKITAAVTNESLNTVKTSIFGANDSWIDDGYGLWDAEKKNHIL